MECIEKTAIWTVLEKKTPAGANLRVSSGKIEKYEIQIPWSIIASATLRNPAMLAPMT